MGGRTLVDSGLVQLALPAFYAPFPPRSCLVSWSAGCCCMDEKGIRRGVWELPGHPVLGLVLEVRVSNGIV